MHTAAPRRGPRPGQSRGAAPSSAPPLRAAPRPRGHTCAPGGRSEAPGAERPRRGPAQPAPALKAAARRRGLRSGMGEEGGGGEGRGVLFLLEERTQPCGKRGRCALLFLFAYLFIFPEERALRDAALSAQERRRRGEDGTLGLWCCVAPGLGAAG